METAHHFSARSETERESDRARARERERKRKRKRENKKQERTPAKHVAGENASFQPMYLLGAYEVVTSEQTANEYVNSSSFVPVSYCTAPAPPTANYFLSYFYDYVPITEKNTATTNTIYRSGHNWWAGRRHLNSFAEG